MHKYRVEVQLLKKFQKIKRKDIKSYNNIMQKIREVVTSRSLDHYKNLKNKLKKYKRVHVNTHFVLLFFYSLREACIVFEDYQHHDIIYRK